MENDDEVSMSFLKEALALCDYYYAPQMHCVTLESKIDRLKARTEKIIAERQAESAKLGGTLF